VNGKGIAIDVTLWSMHFVCWLLASKFKQIIYKIRSFAWFPSLCIRSSVPVLPLSIAKVRNSIAYVKNNVLCFRKLAVAVHPFIQVRVLFFRICRSYALELCPLFCVGNSAPWLLGLLRYYRAQSPA